MSDRWSDVPKAYYADDPGEPNYRFRNIIVRPAPDCVVFYVEEKKDQRDE